MRRANSLAAEKTVAVGQSRVGERVVWIFSDGLTEVIDGLLIALCRALVPVESALQVKLIRLGVSGVALSDPLLFGAGQPLPQFFQNVARDFALHGDQVAEFSIVLFAPNLIAGSRFHQFEIQSQIVAALRHPSQQNGLHS